MFFWISLLRLLRIASRERPIEIKPGVRYRVTLDMTKVRPGKPEADVRNFLMTMGITPTTQPNAWRGEERLLNRIPKDAILKAEA